MYRRPFRLSGRDRDSVDPDVWSWTCPPLPSRPSRQDPRSSLRKPFLRSIFIFYRTKDSDTARTHRTQPTPLTLVDDHTVGLDPCGLGGEGPWFRRLSIPRSVVLRGREGLDSSYGTGEGVGSSYEVRGWCGGCVVRRCPRYTVLLSTFQSQTQDSDVRRWVGRVEGPR